MKLIGPQMCWDQTALEFPQFHAKSSITKGTKEGKIPCIKILSDLLEFAQKAGILKPNKNGNHTWMNDIMMYSSSLPYVDAIVTERSFGSLLKQRGFNKEFKTHVGCKMSEMEAVCNLAIDSPKKETRIAVTELKCRAPISQESREHQSRMARLIRDEDKNLRFMRSRKS